MHKFVNSLRIAVRQLRRAPAFAVTAILTLALGIGANTAIFSLLDQALIRTLPVRDPQQLVTLEDTGTKWQGSIDVNGGTQADVFTYPAYKDLRDHNEVFTGLAGIDTASGINFTHNGVSQLENSELVTGNYFDLLGVHPAVGRLFTQRDDQAPLANPVTVLSFDFWKNNLGADPALIGSTVHINGFPFQIIGVAAPGFHSAIWGNTPQFYFPMAMLTQVMPDPPGAGMATGKPDFLHDPQTRWMSIIGRLKPAETVRQAQAGVAPLWHALRAQQLAALGTRSPAFVDGFLNKSQLLVLPGERGFAFNRDLFRKPFLAVMAMALLVLAISAVNVASLLLVRAAKRSREFALRAALGARNAQVMSQLLTEGLLVGVLGGAVGLLIAPIAIRTLVRYLTDPDNGTGFSSALDGRVLVFNFAISILVSLCFSLVPALQLRKLDLSSTLREARSTGSGGRFNLRRVIVCLQVGLSVFLLMASGLFLQTLHNLRAVDVGFNTSHMVTFGIDPVSAGYKPESVPGLHQRVLDRMSAVPGVISVGATDDAELANNQGLTTVNVAGYPPQPDNPYQVETAGVSPGYFHTLQIPLVAGRLFTDQDTPDHPKVVIVNQMFARHYCGSAQACIGRALGRARDNKFDQQIVGVVRNAHHSSVRADILPTMYSPLKQRPTSAAIQVYLRTTADPSRTLETVRQAMHELDPGLSLQALITMQEQVDRNLTNDRLIALLSVSFGVLATVLAGVGLYGVLAYATAQRTNEIGIRMALGSTRFHAAQLILVEVLRLASIGVVVAIPLSIGMSYLLRAQLYQVPAVDPAIIVSVVALIAIVAALAALLPARRAASINPSDALRSE